MAYSFYGGKTGASIDIKAHFDTVYDLVHAFNGGGSYTTVNYGEYAIVDCPDKSSPENGIIYKRGFEYDIACVLLDMTSDFRRQYPNIEIRTTDFGDGNTYVIAKEGQENAFKAYVENPGGGAVYIGQIVGPTGDTPIVKIETMEELENEPYVRHEGIKDGEVHSDPASATNDIIKYGYAITTDAFGNTTGVAIAFDVPAPQISVTATAFDYDNLEHIMPTELIEKLDTSGLFYSNWRLRVPKGIHGKDFVALEMDENTQQYYYYTKSFDNDYNGIQSDKIYIKNAYLKAIKTIEANRDGKYLKGFTVTYTTLNEDGDNEVEKFNVPTLKSVNLADTGELTMMDTDDAEYDLGIITWVTGFTYNKDTGKYTIHYNTGDEDELTQIFKAIDRIYYDENDNKFKVDYNTGDTEEISEAEKWVTQISFNSTDNRFYATLNDGEAATAISQTIPTIKGFKYLADSLSDSHKIQVTYSRGTGQTDRVEVLENSFGGIADIRVVNNYLYALYDNPDQRNAIPAAQRQTIDGNIYINLGYVRGETGSLQYYGEFDSLSDLTSQFPNGFTGADEGKLASVVISNVHHIFAYDYKNNEWLDLGTLDAGSIEPNKSLVVSDITPTTLNTNGIWLVISE